MQNVCKRFRIWGLLLLVAIFAAGLTSYFTTIRAEAAKKTGFQTINGKTYYIDADGSKHKGWLELNGKRYYFNTKTGVQQKGWMQDANGNKRYFTSNAGAMVTGWIENSKGQSRYFDTKTGIMKTKWLTLNGKKYYLYNPPVLRPKAFSLQTAKEIPDISTILLYTWLPAGWKTAKARSATSTPQPAQCPKASMRSEARPTISTAEAERWPPAG